MKREGKNYICILFSEKRWMKLSSVGTPCFFCTHWRTGALTLD